MKTIQSLIALSVLLLLTACSDSAQSPGPAVTEILAAKAASITPSNSFGTIAYNETKLLTLNIKNTGDTVLPGPATLDAGTNFSLTYQSASCTNLAVSATCTVKVYVNGSTLSSGLKEDVLRLDAAVSFPVSVTVSEKPVASGSSVDMVSTVDFGTLTTSVTKTITIKNISSLVLNQVVSISPPFTNAYDNCSNKNISAGGSCTVKVSLSGSSVPAGGPVTGTLNYGTLKSAALTAQVQSPEQLAALNSNIVAVYLAQNLAPGSTANLGTLQQGSGQLLTIQLKNIGTGSAKISSLALTSTQMSLVSNPCTGASLAPGASCSLKINFTPSGVTPETLSVSLSHGDVRSFNFAYSYQELRKMSVTASNKISITSTPAGITCSSGTCSKSFPKDTTITLNTVLATGLKIASWNAPASCSLIGISMVCELSSDIVLPLPVLACATGYVGTGSNCVLAPTGGPLAFSNLTSGGVVTSNQLTVDPDDGRNKFILNGVCNQNGQQIRVVLDELLGQEHQGSAKSSKFCDDFINYNCSESAELFTTCTNNTFSVKIPLQHLADFWWWSAYGGDTEINAYYVNNPTLSPIKFTFKNHAVKSKGFQSPEVKSSFWFDSVNPMSSDYVNGVFEFEETNIPFVLVAKSARFNNPRNFVYANFPWGYYWDYSESLDQNGHSVSGEGKLSLNSNCSGGNWVRASSGTDHPAIIHNITLPSDGSAIQVSYQFRDTLLNETSECQVITLKKFQYVYPELLTVQAFNEAGTNTISGEKTTQYESFYIDSGVQEGNIGYSINLYNGLNDCQNDNAFISGLGSGMNSVQLPPGTVDFEPYIRMFPSNGQMAGECVSVNLVLHNSNPVLGSGFWIFHDLGTYFIKMINYNTFSFYTKLPDGSIGSLLNTVTNNNVMVGYGAGSGNGYLVQVDNNERTITVFWKKEDNTLGFKKSEPFGPYGMSNIQVDRATNKLLISGNGGAPVSFTLDPSPTAAANAMVLNLKSLPSSGEALFLDNPNKALLVYRSEISVVQDNGSTWEVLETKTTPNIGWRSSISNQKAGGTGRASFTQDGVILNAYDPSDSAGLGVHYFSKDINGNYLNNQTQIIPHLARGFSVSPSGLKMLVRTENVTAPPFNNFRSPYKIILFERNSLNTAWTEGPVLREEFNFDVPNFYWLLGEEKALYFNNDEGKARILTLP